MAPLWEQILNTKSTQPAQPAQPLWQRILNNASQSLTQGAGNVVPLWQKIQGLSNKYIDQPFNKLTQPVEQAYMRKFNVAPEQMAQYKAKSELASSMIMGMTGDLKAIKGLQPLVQEAKKYKSAEEFVKESQSKLALKAFGGEKLTPLENEIAKINHRSKSEADYTSQLTDIWKQATGQFKK